MTIRLILHSNQYSERGDSVNAKGYAKALAESYGIDSILTYPTDSPHNNPKILEEMKQEGFWVVGYRNLDELHAIARLEGVTHSYFMNNGTYSPLWVMGTKRISHAVFRGYEPFGDVYGYCSEWLLKKATSWREALQRQREDFAGRERRARVAEQRKTTRSPYGLDYQLKATWVPHTVFSSEGDGDFFRRKYNIPKGSRLIGRIGGRTEFNDPAAHEAVRILLETDGSVHFCFINTERFLDHPRITYLDFISTSEKWDFYAACEILLNGRIMGESFGFSIVEPLMVGKPVIAPSLTRNRRMDAHHTWILGDLGLLYGTSSELAVIAAGLLETPVSASILQQRVELFQPIHVAELFYSRFLKA